MQALVPWIGDLICTMVYLVVGLKLSVLGNRTGELAERILGIAILFWAASYVIYDVPYLLSGQPEAIIPVVSMSSYVLADIGNFAFAVFTWAVFRRGETWALALIATIGTAMVVGWLGSAWMADWEFLGLHGSRFHWLERAGASLTSLWMGYETLRYYRGARLRRGLGLCDPMACNRYLLLAIAAAFWLAMDVSSVAYILLGGTGGIAQLLSSVLQVEATLSAFGAVLIGIAFFPPAFYRRRIESGSHAPAA